MKAKNAPRLKRGCEGACRVARVWGSGEEWCISDEKEWTLARKSCCFPRRDREGERGGREEGQRPVVLSMGASPDRRRSGGARQRTAEQNDERGKCYFEFFVIWGEYPLSCLKMSGLCVLCRARRSARPKVFGRRLSHFAPFDCIGKCSPAVSRSRSPLSLWRFLT